MSPARSLTRVADPDSARAEPPASPSPVAALTRGLTRGDETAYRAFHAAYFDRLLRYLLVVARGDEHAAREALQATLLRVARHVRVFDDETVFWSWLTVLARSALADQHRGRRRYLAFLDRFSRHATAEAESSPEPSDTGGALDSLLAGQLALLAVEDRDLLHLKYRENRSVREIARQLAASEKSVESRLSRLRARLKAEVLARLRASTR